jgi:hypothetical protein
VNWVDVYIVVYPQDSWNIKNRNISHNEVCRNSPTKADF